ncbi:MAG: hypothetical protein ABMB14_32415, partial [Myxococcota bacterium]
VVVGLLAPDIGRDASHLGRAMLAAAAIALVAVRFVLARTGAGERAIAGFTTALAATSVVAAFNYFQFDGKVFSGINDYTDTAYYYTNSKYLGELGYDGLYAAALVCDEERGGPRTSHIRTIRDLRDDELQPRAEELVHGAEVKAAFSPERWAGFCHDITYFLDRLDKKALETNFFVDHGYNPPPTWSVFGGNLALAVDVENLKWICHVDTVLIVAMVGIVWWAFGIETALWALLFYSVTFSGRWPILGMAILRFDWVVALVAGVCLLRTGRYGPAGAAMAYAALNRVFPAIFFWGWLIEAVLDTLRERRVPQRHLRFAAGAAIASVLITGVAAVEYGPKLLSESAYHLSLHNESFSSHRVGLGTVLVYRGETTRDDIRANGGMRPKELAVQSMEWGLRGAGIVALGLIAALAWRMDRTGRAMPAWELVALVMLPLWCATTPQVNYYNLRLVPIVWHASKMTDARGDPLHATGLALLFAVEIAAQLAHVWDYERFTVNAFASIGLLGYFVVVWTWLAIRASRS